jgi:ferrous iron transport protein A
MHAAFDLTRLPVHHRARISHIPETTLGLTRLRELGFTPGTQVEVMRHSAWGSPMQVKVRGSHLALRVNEAQQILVATEESA